MKTDLEKTHFIIEITKHAPEKYKELFPESDLVYCYPETCAWQFGKMLRSSTDYLKEVLKKLGDPPAKPRYKDAFPI